MSFRENLLHLRAANNMTQEQLAMQLGVSRQSVTKWEAEKSYPEMDKLLKLCQLFDCTLDDLVQGDLTNREPSPDATPATSAPPADVFDYDRTMRRFAMRVPLGIALAIAGVALSLLIFSAGDSETPSLFRLPEGYAAALGMLVLFAGVAGCLLCIIPAGMTHAAFVKEHPYIEDFYTAEEKASARTSFTYQLIGGIVCIFLGICAVVFFSEMTESPVGATCMLLLIAVGVFFIVHGAMMMGRTNIAQYNESAVSYMEVPDIEAANIPEAEKQEMLHTKKVDQKVGAACGTIMIVATVVAMVMLFAPEAFGDHDRDAGMQAIFWLPWVVGGLLCGIVAMWMKAFSKDE